MPLRAAALATLGAVAAHRMELHRVQDNMRLKRDAATNTRLRRLENGKFEAVPLHLGLGTHYTWVYAGTPPQRASVIVDTGSHLMAFPCNGCETCGKHTDAPFDTSKSSTLKFPSCSSRPAFACSACGKDDQCHISQSYTEGSSWNAVVVEDTVWLGDETAHAEKRLDESFGTRYMFGCQNKETGLFTSQVADGIMGVANTESNLIRKLYNEKKLESSAFALCFAPRGGTMAIGTLSTAHHLGEIQYAAIPSQHNGWFGVTVKALKFGDRELNVDTSHMNTGHRVIVDSGTTDSYFPSAYASAWTGLFASVTGQAYQEEGNNCHGYSDDDILQMPPFEVHLQGVDPSKVVILRIPATQLFPKNENNQRCGSMYFTESSGGVIGANFMMNHEFVFDADNKRVGFSEAVCDYRGLEVEMSATQSQSNTSSVSNSPTTQTPSPTTQKPATTQTPAPTTLSSSTISPIATNSSLLRTSSPAVTEDASTPSPTLTIVTKDGASTSLGAKNATISDFSPMGVLVFVAFAAVAVMSAYHFWYKKRNVVQRKREWVQVSTIQTDDDVAERVPLGEEPLSLRGDEEDSDDDEFFDSEGYVMSPRSIKRAREAFDL